MIAVSTEVIDTIITAVLLLAGTVTAAWLQTRKTRRMNTEEHDRGAAERALAHDAQMMALGRLEGKVDVLSDDLHQHIKDPHAHR